jgi:hypothetical protein
MRLYARMSSETISYATWCSVKCRQCQSLISKFKIEKCIKLNLAKAGKVSVLEAVRGNDMSNAEIVGRTGSERGVERWLGPVYIADEGSRQTHHHLGHMFVLAPSTPHCLDTLSTLCLYDGLGPPFVYPPLRSLGPAICVRSDVCADVMSNGIISCVALLQSMTMLRHGVCMRRTFLYAARLVQPI